MINKFFKNIVFVFFIFSFNNILLSQATSNFDHTDNEVFSVVEVNPEFPGGRNEMIKFINKNIDYEKIIKQLNGNPFESNLVIIQFIVNSNGKISDIKVVKEHQNSIYSAELIRVVKLMPNWSPGTIKEIPKAVRYTLPYKFVYNN